MAEKPAAGHESGGEIRQSKAVTDDAVSTWFVREIMPFEANLMHYLQRNWRNASEIADLRQEVYARVLAAAQERIPENPKHFLLVCARNLLIDLVRREQVVPMDSFGDFDALGIASTGPEPERLIIEHQELSRMETALEQLPARTHEAIALAYFQGLSGKEIAKRMGISQSRVSHYLAEGALILGDILYGAPAERSPKS